MTNYLNTIFSLILAFIVLVLAPLNLSFLNDRGAAQLVIMNETSEFLDKVTDKGKITQADIDELNMNLNSHGIVIDCDVKRLVRTSVVTPDEKMKTMYISADANVATDPSQVIHNLNRGDTVQVIVKEVTRDAASKLYYGLLRIELRKTDFTFAKVVS
jgi:hypothetical protein